MRFQKKCFCIFRRKGLHLQRFVPFLHTETAKTVYFFGIHGTSFHEESEEKNEQKTGVSLKHDYTILYKYIGKRLSTPGTTCLLSRTTRLI